MRIVYEPIGSPHCCAVHPQFAGVRERGYFDTGNELAGGRMGAEPHIYVAVDSVEELARQLDWKSPGEFQEHMTALDTALERVRELEQENDRLQQGLDAIDYIGSHGFVTRRKTGRPSNQEREKRAERSAA